MSGVDMGEMADDIIDGLACSSCGLYFVSDHGYPVMCAYCFEEEAISRAEDEDPSCPLATYPEA